MIINFNKTTFNKKYIQSITKAYSEALKILKVKCKDLEVNISFVSKKEIRDLNNKFRSKDSVTDVLSFPNLLEPGKTDMQLITDTLTRENFKSEINPDTNAIFVGDICICKPIAFKHAKEYGNTKLREMTYMAVHGLLHLLGYDHMNIEDEKEMFNLQEAILDGYGIKR